MCSVAYKCNKITRKKNWTSVYLRQIVDFFNTHPHPPPPPPPPPPHTPYPPHPFCPFASQPASLPVSSLPFRYSTQSFRRNGNNNKKKAHPIPKGTVLTSFHCVCVFFFCFFFLFFLKVIRHLVCLRVSLLACATTLSFKFLSLLSATEAVTAVHRR